MSRTIRNERDPDNMRKGPQRNPHAKRVIAHTFAVALVAVTIATGARAESTTPAATSKLAVVEL